MKSTEFREMLVTIMKNSHHFDAPIHYNYTTGCDDAVDSKCAPALCQLFWVKVCKSMHFLVAIGDLQHLVVVGMVYIHFERSISG